MEWEENLCDFSFQLDQHFIQNLHINYLQHQDHQMELWQGPQQDQDF